MNEFIIHRHRNHSKMGRYFHTKSTYVDYHWIPAKSWTPNTYTLVNFLGYDRNLPQDLIQNDSYNLLCIVDRSGLHSRGSWYFGKKGVPTTLNFVVDFIKQFCLAGLIDQNNIIFSGKGMGGHMALFCQQKFGSLFTALLVTGSMCMMSLGQISTQCPHPSQAVMYTNVGIVSPLDYTNIYILYTLK